MSSQQPPTALQSPIARKLVAGAMAISAIAALTIDLAETMSLYVAVGVGSALGGMARFWCSGLVAGVTGETFPWGTLFVNVTGSFVIGFFGTLTSPDGRVLVGSTARQFVMVGICGGYTTFSSFSLQTLNLLNDGEGFRAGLNVSLSLVLCLLAVWAGYALASAVGAIKFV
jgi:CrcB protein